MFLDFLFIIRLTSVAAPSGDQVLGINMSSQKGEHRHFDSYTREPRLHLTPASHLLSRSAPVLTQCEALEPFLEQCLHLSQPHSNTQ